MKNTIDNENTKNRNLNNPRINYFSTTQALTMFFTGFLGLNILSYLVYSIILKLFPNMTSIDLSTFTNFISYVILAASLIAISYSFNKNKFMQNFIRLRDKKLWLFILYGLILIFIVAIIISNIQQHLYYWLEIDATTNANQEAIDLMLTQHPILILIMVSVLAPIVEEIAYRQGLFESIRPKSQILAYIATILIFSSIHFDWIGSFYDSENGIWTINYDTLLIELIALPSYIGGGAVLSYIYDHENNVIPGIFVHGLYNMIGILIVALS
ncbi:MAG: type II CAAX endopeptidase family protein [Bacilli bacterium]